MRVALVFGALRVCVCVCCLLVTFFFFLCCCENVSVFFTCVSLCLCVSVLVCVYARMLVEAAEALWLSRAGVCVCVCVSDGWGCSQCSRMKHVLQSSPGPPTPHLTPLPQPCTTPDAPAGDYNSITTPSPHPLFIITLPVSLPADG